MRFQDIALCALLICILGIEAFLPTPITNGRWIDVSPTDFSKYSKVRTLVRHNGELFAGVGENNFGDADIWRISDVSSEQIAGEDNATKWLENNKVNVLLSNEGQLWAGLGEVKGEIWRMKSGRWQPILTHKDPEFGPYHYIYSGAVWSDRPCFGAQGWAGSNRDTNKGPDILCFDGKKFNNIDTSHLFEKRNYRNVYSMRVFNNSLIIGLGNMYPNGKSALLVQHNDISTTIIGGNNVANSWGDSDHLLPLSMAEHHGSLFVSFLKQKKQESDGLPIWSFDGQTWTDHDIADVKIVVPNHLALNGTELLKSNTLINKIISYKDHLILLAGGQAGGGNTVWAWNVNKNYLHLIGGYGVNDSWDEKWPKICNKNADNVYFHEAIKTADHRECTRTTWIYTAEVIRDELYIGVARANGYLAKIYKYKPL